MLTYFDFHLLTLFLLIVRHDVTLKTLKLPLLYQLKRGYSVFKNATMLLTLNMTLF
jgi:hypothetical protein